jgi:SecD/SecF fusion protein
MRGRISPRVLLIQSLVLASFIGFSASDIWSQDADTTAPAAEEKLDTDAPPAESAPEESSESQADSAPPAAAPADATSDSDAAADRAAPTPPESSTTPATTTPAAESGETPSSRDPAIPAGKTDPSIANKTSGDSEEVGSGWNTLGLALGILALFVIPILAGNYLAKVWKMPDHAWKISLCLWALATAIIICVRGPFKAGPDLAGGITLVYELADPEAQAALLQQTQDDSKQGAEAPIRVGGRDFQLNELIGALKRRLDPDGTKEITIRKYGADVEIIIPETGPDELQTVKRKITDMGQLEFRILADPAMTADRLIIERAKQLPSSRRVLSDKENKIAEWVAYDVDEFGPVDQDTGIVKRKAGETPEALVLIDAMNVTGEYLKPSSKGIDERGGPAVLFTFDAEGARRFGHLTGQNLPNIATKNLRRRLGIILDKVLLSAPEIEERITTSGRISGRNMTEDEVDHVIEILNAGSLPVVLNKEPISEEIISPTLGGETVEKGEVAIIWSFVAVGLFMMIYYRFAGIVACLALGFNLLLVVALMVLINAAFTLPGLAGLVLTIGMSVDANVLIYERIREELQSGAALRMAIRNGFSRAMTAIIDTNVTTIISGFVLYYIGTDQIKGFAVTLILGIVTSMFTAVFFARVVFDVAERRGWITRLHMMRLMAPPNIDFLRYRWTAIGASMVLIVIGMVALYFRGPQMLDIDFTGGSSVTFTLNEAGKMPIGQVRDALQETELAEKNLVVVERGQSGARYAVDTSEESVDAVKQVISEKFGDKLMKYSLEVRDFAPFTDGELTGTQAILLINFGPSYANESGLSHDALRELITGALAKAGHADIQVELSNPNYRQGSGARFKEWTVRLTGLDQAAAQQVFDALQTELNTTPLFPMANKIGGRVSGNMQSQALLATAICLLAVVGYLWLRFSTVSYGIAAGVALLHDVLVTIGMMALSAYVLWWVPGLAAALQLDAFQINLTIVAALLTILGYQINDTIVTFDRLREIKGKSPEVTPEMVNMSVNQTLSRTMLTATTVFMVVVILYFFGGEGIHGFAFVFLIGVIAGTFSTIYIAAPVLLWLESFRRRYFSAATGPAARTARPRLSEVTR